MPKFIIGRSYGYAGTSSEDEVEADNLEDAENMALEFALENVESWAKPVDDDQQEDGQ